MFGRELTEQVRADSRIGDRMVPIIVEKCIAAVDATGTSLPARIPINIVTDSSRVALDYEGIYRKTGGSGQSKLITQLFERGDYAAFDLLDRDRFNDICSTTSVLKSYLRTLPNPLLTFVLHDEFIFASSIPDPAHRSAKYADLVKQLPTEHYYTLRTLMLHLNRIQEHREQNLMTARNLGVVFGRMYHVLLLGLTFMYSRDDRRSDIDAFPQSRSRVQRHGRQGADHRMARRKRANDFPAIADALIINLISQSFPCLLSPRSSSNLIPHVFTLDRLCLHNVLLSHIPLRSTVYPSPPLFGLI